MNPNERAQNAYRRGYKAHGEGLHPHDNPWDYFICCDPREEWWDTGYFDAEMGKPNRFGDDDA